MLLYFTLVFCCLFGSNECSLVIRLLSKKKLIPNFLMVVYKYGSHSVPVKTGQRPVDPRAVYIFIRQRQNQTGNGQRAITGISEAEQRRKQYQAGVEVTSTGSEFQGKAVRGQTQK